MLNVKLVVRIVTSRLLNYLVVLPACSILVNCSTLRYILFVKMVPKHLDVIVFFSSMSSSVLTFCIYLPTCIYYASRIITFKQRL